MLSYAKRKEKVSLSIVSSLLLVAVEHPLNIEWQQWCLQMDWKDTKAIPIFPKRWRKRMILTFLSHRPKSALEQILKDKDLQNKLSQQR